MVSSKQHQVYGASTSISAPSSSSATNHHHRGFAGSSSRQQARLGVTTDYIDLSLHSAAANGNIGLVKYALEHGQPVNSVLNGVLPLHAAASSGNEQVVRMLIEAGADVNSPRLPRRYSNEKTKTSGLAAGTAGSTPLHFAAANGHVPIIQMLLHFGAKPTATEKYGLTPEMLAQQKGHVDAAQVLREWAEADEADEANSIKEGKNSSSASLKSTLSKKRLHPRRSLDALAVRLQQTASNPHLLAQHLPHASSSASLHSITPSITSGNRDVASYQSSLARNKSLPGHVKEGSSTRRPSLPSVFEKAAHPSAAIRQALGMKKALSATTSSSSHGLRKSSSKSSLSGAVWGKDPKRDLLEEEDELEESDLEADELDGAARDEVPYRRRSEELVRSNSKRASVGSLASVQEAPSTAPASKTGFYPGEYSTAPSPTLSRTGSISAAGAAAFYRPRQSSQLSGRATSSAAQSPPNSPRVFIDDEDDDDLEATPRDANEVSVSAKTLRVGSPSQSPSRLRSSSTHLHRRENSSTSSQYSLQTPSRILSGAVTPDSQPTTSRPTSDDGTSAASGHSHSRRGEQRRAPSRATSVGSKRTMTEPVRRGAGFVVRDRADSASSTASSVLSRRHLPTKLAANSNLSEAHARQQRSGTTTPEPTVFKKVETRTSRSNSAGTDGRFSSSPASSYSGPGTLSTYAPSTNSTTATSVATSKSSHQSSPVPHHHARLPGLSPLYETSALSNPLINSRRLTHHQSLASIPATTSAEARSRVKKVEQELLEYNASASSASGASTMKNGQHVAPNAATSSLTDKLAAYGQGLALERKLKAMEKGIGRASNSGYRIETIGKSTLSTASSEDGAASTTSTIQSSPKLAVPVPQWRAIPPVDRLMPPAAVAGSGRRSVSPVSGLAHAPPSATATASTPSPSRKGSRDADTHPSITVVPIAASTSGTSSGTGPPTRASSPTSSRSNKSLTHTLRQAPFQHHHHASSPPSIAVPIAHKVLGNGENGVSYVEALPPPSSSPSTSHHHHHRGVAPNSSASSAHRASSSQKGSGSVTSVKDQVESDAIETARLAAQIPSAPITLPSNKKSGFAKRFFGRV